MPSPGAPRGLDAEHRGARIRLRSRFACPARLGNTCRRRPLACAGRERCPRASTSSPCGHSTAHPIRSGDPMSRLFTPLTLRDVTVRNRLWVSPMCQYSAVDGVPQEWHHTHLAQFASGGAGSIVAEATAVSPEGRISPEDTGLWNDEQRDAWAPIVDGDPHAAARSPACSSPTRDARPRRGRRSRAGAASVAAADGGWTTVAPSAIAFDGFAEPVALDLAGIDRVVADFAAAARRAVDRRLPGARAARRTRLPAAPVPLAAVEPARRRVRRLAREPRAPAAAGARCGDGCRARRSGDRAVLRHRLGRRRVGCRRDRDRRGLGRRARRRLLRHLQRRTRRPPEAHDRSRATRSTSPRGCDARPACR